MQQVTFKSDDLTIHGTLCLPESAKKPFPGVIIFHGMTSSENSYVPLAKLLAERGIAALAISMRGHGASEGNIAESTVSEATIDGMAAYDFLNEQEDIDVNRIGLVGSSVGAILAALTTQQRSVKSLVLRAPAAYTTEMMQLTMAETMINERRQFYGITNLEDTPAGHAIADYRGSLLIVASENDSTIPSSITEGYLSIASSTHSKKLRVLEGAPHNLRGTEWKDACNRIIYEWLEKTL